ncbi:MAG: DNA polymerase [Bacteroidetes bacterium]|nr:DNA polymerase [Bacteroidota bacterium]
MDSILFGKDPEENIVAVHQLSDSSVRIFKRSGDIVASRDEQFFPFFHLSQKRFIENYPKQFWLKKLEGNNFYQYVCAFPSLALCRDAVNFVLRTINKELRTNYHSFLDTEHILFRADTSTQYLLQSGKTLFKGMSFNDLYRMQIDIETYSASHSFSRAERTDDRIIFIAVSDNRGFETVLGGKHVTEKNLLQQCRKLIVEKDPDVIEGHNIFNFDLPYLMKRFELHALEFSIGRDGSAPKGYSTRSAFAERELEYTSYEVFGRHIIDTWLLVEAYDHTKRSMESHSLKYAARFFDISAKNRTYIDGNKISWYWENDPETLKNYAIDDVIETRALSEKLSGSNFSLTKMLPYNYGTVAHLGSAAKIESLFLREYLLHRHSLPKPQKGTQTTGGYTDVFYTGVFSPIIHVDVESLYPSIMLSKNLQPRTDALNVFHTALEHLTALRLQTKKLLAESLDEQERSTLDALQSSYKILINSFYGYLGYMRGLFNDYAAADIVTTTGQELLKLLINEIERYNGTVIEVDTDGIYFIPPDNLKDEAAERNFVRNLSALLPQGINLGFNGRYKKILSYKKKNYALLHYDNRITMRGSSLVSRSIERFGRTFIQQCIDFLLNENFSELHALYLELEKAIREHSLDIKDFLKTESLKDSLKQYQEEVAGGSRNRSSVYEVALNSSRPFKIGDKVSYYITGTDANIKSFEHSKEARDWDANFPDENTAFYLKRLREFTKKFEVFFSEQDFLEIFSTENLFGFDASKIKILNKKVEDETERDESGQTKIEFDTDDF